MKAMKFRPCIDLRDGKPVQVVGGSFSNDLKTVTENFVAPEDRDSVYYAELYKQNNLRDGHIVMLGGQGNGNKEAALKAIKAYKNAFQIGGSINPDNAYEFLEAGASKVIVTSFIFTDGDINFKNLEKMVNTVGKDKVVLDVSCKKKDYFIASNGGGMLVKIYINEEQKKQLEEKIPNLKTQKEPFNAPPDSAAEDFDYLLQHESGLSPISLTKSKDYYVFYRNWTKPTNFVINPDNLEKLAGYAPEFLLHGIAFEGKKKGIDKVLIELFSDFLLNRPEDAPEIISTYAGGIRTWNHISFIDSTAQRKMDFTVGTGVSTFGGPLRYKKLVDMFGKPIFYRD